MMTMRFMDLSTKEHHEFLEGAIAARKGERFREGMSQLWMDGYAEECKKLQAKENAKQPQITQEA